MSFPTINMLWLLVFFIGSSFTKKKYTQLKKNKMFNNTNQWRTLQTLHYYISWHISPKLLYSSEFHSHTNRLFLSYRVWRTSPPSAWLSITPINLPSCSTCPFKKSLEEEKSRASWRGHVLTQLVPSEGGAESWGSKDSLTTQRVSSNRTPSDRKSVV